MKWDLNEYAFSTWTLESMPLKEALQLIRRYDFTDLELWANCVHLDPSLSPDLGQVKTLLKENGQTVHSIHSTFSFPQARGLEEAAFRAQRMACWKENLDQCQALEAPIMVIHAVGLGYAYPPQQAHIVRDCLAELCEYGQHRGVDIALENIASGTKPGELLCTLENQVKIFDIPELRFCLDIGHVALNGGVMEREIDCAAEKLVTFHVSNNDGLHDLHNTPDCGELDWGAIHDYARHAGYQGKFVFEICGGANPEEMLRRTRSLFDM